MRMALEGVPEPIYARFNPGLKRAGKFKEVSVEIP
jgi:hypothetical protein